VQDITLDDITTMLIELEMDDIASAIQEKLDMGTDPQDLLNALTKGMDSVGERYEQGEYFLTELVLAGETMKEAFSVLKPHIVSCEKGQRTPIIVTTVHGDNHDIGKNILGTMLISSGYDVIDLGVDCPRDKIVQAVRDTGAKVVALSCLLTMALEEISSVNTALSEAGLREGVKLIVGGVPLNKELALQLGADDYGADAVEGVRRITALLKE
jgi:dimethylamine corrinoid protein